MLFQIAAPKYWPLPKQYDNLKTLMEPLNSFVFVRNPFDRLVSVYKDKIVGNPMGAWKSLSIQIIHEYRMKHKGAANPTIPR